jgi:hypothetical protein
MLGWMRRNRKDRQRRERFHRWWLTLNKDQKRAYRKADAEFQRKFNSGVMVIAIICAFTMLVIWWLS